MNRTETACRGRGGEGGCKSQLGYKSELCLFLPCNFGQNVCSVNPQFLISEPGDDDDEDDVDDEDDTTKSIVMVKIK